MSNFYAHGKLLLTGEYVVLDGAKALAIPTRLGQHMEVVRTRALGLGWKSLDFQGNCWLNARLGPLADDQLAIGQTTQLERLRQIIDAALEIRPEALPLLRSKSVTTRLEFDQAWGLGSSSSLISLLAQYLEINPYLLLSRSFGGSGYDIACATAAGPITYQLSDELALPQVETLHWQPDWLQQSYFVYSGQKQNSREGIRHYRQQKVQRTDIDSISGLTAELLVAATAPEVQKIILEHERIIGALTRQTPVKERLFPDFPGTIKSLGAWGGDFVWVLSEEGEETVKTYFKKQGLEVVLPYNELALIT